MSEMFRPTPQPAAPNHDQHDRLLVAQVAAGDPLDRAQAELSRGWLATCPACAALAAELGAVSRAVAGEPLPPRRRDFRLTPEQAERARGSSISRFLRGLSWSRGRAFAPAAAGVMSIGLAFVVVGYAWPDDGTLPVGTDAAMAPAAVEERLASTPAAAEESLAGTPLPALATLAPAEVPEAAPAAPDADADVEFYASEPEALEGLAEHQAGTSARSQAAQKSLASEMSDEVVAGAAAVAADESYEDEAEVGREVAGEAFTEASDMANALDLGAVGAEQVDAAVATQEPAAPVSEVVAAGDDEGGLERWLLLVGVALAIAGGFLLLLAWLSRRTADPLLR